MNKIAISAIISTLYILTGCSSPGPKRVFLDSSSHEDSPPNWVKHTKTTWEKDGKIFLRSAQQVRGNERTNGCYDLAKLDAKETLLSEIANDVRGTIDNAQQSINEDAENLLGKARSAEFKGRITGLRFEEEYFERYKIEDKERIDCFVLSVISQDDYNKLKRTVVDKIEQVDARLREAVTQKHIDFFKISEETKK